MKNLLALYGGSSQHFRTLFEPKYNKYFDVIYLLDFANVDLSLYDGLLIPSRTSKNVLSRFRENILQFLNDDKVVISLGEQPIPWLPGVDWEHRPTNFWWWLDSDPKSGIECMKPDHDFFDYIKLKNATWHYHGIFHPPDGVDNLIGTESGESILYIDKISTSGTMLITSLDPDFHFGSYFMPAAERFLDGFLPFISEKVL